jgi:hydroxypyruvate reductase
MSEGADREIRSVDEILARETRNTAREIFSYALTQSRVDRAFERHVFYERGILRVVEDLYDLSAYRHVFVVSIGKAAHTMVESLMSRIGPGIGITGIVCGPEIPSTQVFGFRYFRGGHPTPNADSLRAGEAILRALENRTQNCLVIFLLSGGGSALVEKPVSDTITLEDLEQTYRVLVHSGAPIAEINAIRKHLSSVKGGRLALAAQPAHQVSILISDVPEDSLDSLASGPTMPDSSTIRRCHEIVRKHRLLPQFPPSVRELFERGELEETPKKGDAAFVRSRWWPVLSNSTVQRAAIERAALAGFAVEADNVCDDWDYAKAADHLLERLRELRKGVSRVCLISGGEVTVTVKGESGVGGRNQQFALYCAQKIAGDNITVLSAGTDGIDGNSPAAGAIVDGTTLSRAERACQSVDAALNSFNATPFFDSLGDLITTGPTGNNVRDLRVLLAW